MLRLVMHIPLPLADGVREWHNRRGVEDDSQSTQAESLQNGGSVAQRFPCLFLEWIALLQKEKVHSLGFLLEPSLLQDAQGSRVAWSAWGHLWLGVPGVHQP